MYFIAAMISFSRRETCSIADVTAPVVINLVLRGVLRKKARGSGRHLSFTLDDVLRVAIAKTLTTSGVDVSGIKELFAAIDRPSLPGARPWRWLWTRERVDRGAVLVLVTESPKRPPNTGTATLLPKAEAFTIVPRLRGKILIIDVGVEIARIEQRTGHLFLDADPTPSA